MPTPATPTYLVISVSKREIVYIVIILLLLLLFYCVFILFRFVSLGMFYFFIYNSVAVVLFRLPMTLKLLINKVLS